MPSSDNNRLKPLASSPAEDESLLEGTIERITFHNEENGYTVLRILPVGSKDVVTAIGTFLNPAVGEHVICYGRWTKHAQWGSQMQVSRYEVVRPASAFAIEKYLGSGLIKGVGPVTAKRIVARFGEEALDIIDRSPRRLLEIPGLGEKRVTQIRRAWDEQREVRNIMLFLQSHGASPAYAVRIYRTYGAQSIEVVERNPYQLATDVWGIGFKLADGIARHMGIKENDPRRIEAGVEYVLSQAVETGGNAFLMEADLGERAAEILGVETVAAAIDALVGNGRIIRETASLLGTSETAIYTPMLYNIELSLAERLKELGAKPSVAGFERKAPEWLTRLLAHASISPSEEQDRAVRLVLGSSVSVITGGPGTGKTTTLKAVVAALEGLERRVLLASPTGRAAKRLAEVTGREAKTAHRLLEFEPETHRFKHNADNPLGCDALVIDEASMLDMVLTNHVLKALPDHAQLIFVGDVDQLPSVGPGNVLRDIIQSGAVPVARLTQIFRQAQESLIVTNAHRINSGQQPLLPPASAGQDCVHIDAQEAEEVAEKVVAVVARSLPKRGFSPDMVQVLTPMQRGSSGAAHLNLRLQEVLNPPKPGKLEAQRRGRVFRVGDRVMQMVNNYDKGIYNGDIGILREIDEEEGGIVVDYGATEAFYDLPETDELTLAYACSIHKSQGSEYPAVVIAIHPQHFVLLERNLLYTALTRARKMAVFIGPKSAIATAVKRESGKKRNTRLRERLQGML